MPLFNEILNPRLISPLVRIFGMKTGGNPAPSLAPEVQPGLDVNQMDDPAAYFIRRSRLLASFGFAGPVVGQNYEFQLRNPVGSGVLLVVRELGVSSLSSTNYGTRIQTADFTPSTAGTLLDSRWLASGAGATRTAIVSQQTSAVPTFFTGGLFFGNDVGVRQMYVTVAPGTAFGLACNTANTACSVSIVWEERPVMAEELQTG